MNTIRKGNGIDVDVPRIGIAVLIFYNIVLLFYLAH